MPTSQPIMVRGSLRAWRNAVFAVFALSGLGFASWVSRIPAVRDGMHLSTATIGLMLFGLAFGSIAGLATAPNYMARMGTRNGLRYSLLAMAGATVLLGLAAGVWGSFLASAGVLVLFGFFYSITDVVMNVEGADVEKANGRTLLPMMHAFFSLGTIIGAALGAVAAMNSLPVGIHFTVVGLAIAAAGSWSVLHIPGPGAKVSSAGPAAPAAAADFGRHPRFGARLRETLKMAAEPQLFFLGLMVIGMAFVEGSANDWLPLAAVDGHGFNNAGGALVYGTFVAAMTVGRAAGGPLIDRLGRRHTLTIMGALGFLGLLVFILTNTHWTAFGAAALWGLGGSLGFPIGVSAAADHPTHSARRVSIISIFGYMAFLVGPPVLGLLGEHFGILNALYLVALMLLLSLLVAPRAMRASAR
ncbi:MULTISPECIES: MFS transporter [Micrococcaceae]|uniref:Membrane protein mosC n=1 Tax=Arthrobacter rhombi TaxID=71253 RepID=A0A1R4G7M6_9MICC|nr:MULTISPECIES: MFS transporter [Micrococcaceae]PCC25437.1 MFS transporter [Glutamicibacter sp. BW78]SJM64075.1 Membrane protein mosC [Arthrobacter rhombi]